MVILRYKENVFGISGFSNGKMRDKIVVSTDSSKETVLELAKQTEKIQAQLLGKTIRKEIYIPNKLVNLVVS